MKVILTMEEVRKMVREATALKLASTKDLPQAVGVRFIHKHSDGSGETDMEDITTIDRVEVGPL